jgi:hypothetical protein
MKKPAHPAQQLPLCLSVEASVDLARQIEAAQWRLEELEAELLARQEALAKLEARHAKAKKLQAYWERRAKQAEAERDRLYQNKLDDMAHPLHTECQRLSREVDDLRRTLRQWVERTLGAPERGAGNDILTKLLVVAHPDRWSQGQPATELAHELAIQINALRARMGGQP